MTHGLVVSRDGLTLVVGLNTIGGDQWSVMALETPTQKKIGDPDVVASVNAVLDNHSHKVIGVFDFGQAIAEAEKYADAWLARAGAPADDACGCQDIKEFDIDGVAFSALGSLTPSQRRALARSKTETRRSPSRRTG